MTTLHGSGSDPSDDSLHLSEGDFFRLVLFRGWEHIIPDSLL